MRFKQRDSIVAGMVYLLAQEGVKPFSDWPVVVVVDVPGKGAHLVDAESGKVLKRLSDYRRWRSNLEQIWSVHLPQEPNPLRVRRRKIAAVCVSIGSAVLAAAMAATGFGAAAAPLVLAAGAKAASALASGDTEELISIGSSVSSEIVEPVVLGDDPSETVSPDGLLAFRSTAVRK